jgi:hypothetical protein
LLHRYCRLKRSRQLYRRPTSFVPILKELFFLRLTDVATGSSIAITSGRFDELDTLITITVPTATSQLGFEFLRLAHENDTNTEITRGCERAINFSVWRVVASHSVENDLAR